MTYDGVKPLYAWYVVGLLVIAYTFSFIDRQILSLLVGPMKRDLGISDTQVSLLQGFAFALFYSVMGLPIGRMVDSHNRVRIISLGIFFWSLMTALCGIARSYGQLFLYRMGVGVGEAALSPAAYSMLTDYFKPERQGLALGIYSTGIYIGAGLALIIGGGVVQATETMSSLVLPVFGEIYPWQMVFLIVGLPGLPLALWMASVREPKRHGAGAGGGSGVPLSTLFAYINANRRTIFCHNISLALISTMSYGVAAWIPTFYIRTFGWTAGEAGIVYGLIIVVFGTGGVIAGGWLGDWLTRRGVRNGKMRVHLICALGTLPFAVMAPLAGSAALATTLIIPATFFATLTTGAGAAGIQELMPNRMRGSASALMIFVINLIGLGLGPTMIALATDYLFQDDMMLRYSLSLVPLVILALAALVTLAGLKPYAASRDYLERWQAGQSKAPAE